MLQVIGTSRRLFRERRASRPHEITFRVNSEWREKIRNYLRTNPESSIRKLLTNGLSILAQDTQKIIDTLERGHRAPDRPRSFTFAAELVDREKSELLSLSRKVGTEIERLAPAIVALAINGIQFPKPIPPMPSIDPPRKMKPPSDEPAPVKKDHPDAKPMPPHPNGRTG